MLNGLEHLFMCLLAILTQPVTIPGLEELISFNGNRNIRPPSSGYVFLCTSGVSHHVSFPHSFLLYNLHLHIRLILILILAVKTLLTKERLGSRIRIWSSPTPTNTSRIHTTSTTWEAQTVNLGYSRQLSVGVKTWPFLTWFFSLEAETSPLTGSGSPPVHLLLHLLHRLPGASVFWLHRGRSHCLYKVPKSRELPDIGGAERAR